MPWTTWCVLTDFNDHHASHRASRRALWDDDGAFSSGWIRHLTIG